MVGDEFNDDAVDDIDTAAPESIEDTELELARFDDLIIISFLLNWLYRSIMIIIVVVVYIFLFNFFKT